MGYITPAPNCPPKKKKKKKKKKYLLTLDILNLYDFRSSWTQRYVGNQTVSVPIDFHCMDKNRIEVNGNQNC